MLGNGLLLSLCEQIGYDYSKLEEAIDSTVAKMWTAIWQIEAMTQEDFIKRISRDLFGVASKDYYINRLKLKIAEFRNMKSKIDYYLQNQESCPEIFEWMLKNAFKGEVRQARKTFVALAKSRNNGKQK